jgi:small subunit ribosomal protein S16
MLMMRLQRVGRKNDPSYRIVVTDKRTGPKSDKHVDRLGSYNPKMNHIQIDADKAKEWLAKGVQPSATMHNLLISQKVIKGDKINVLPKKAPIIDEEAIKKAEEEAAAKAEAESAEEAPAEDEKTEEAAEEAPAEETAEEVAPETEEASEETPAEAEEEKKEDA